MIPYPWSCNDPQCPDDAINLSEKWLDAFTEKVGVPRDCISFLWSRDGFNRYMVHIVFIPLSDESPARLVDDHHCVVCATPCDYADDDLMEYRQMQGDGERRRCQMLPVSIRRRACTGQGRLSGKSQIQNEFADEDW